LGCAPEGWLLGKICKIQEQYVQVEAYETKKHYQWFHVDSNDLKLFQPRLSSMPSFEREWFRGRIIQVKDAFGDGWKQAEVLLIEKTNILISYLNSTEKFREWLNLDDKMNLQRIRIPKLK